MKLNERIQKVQSPLIPIIGDMVRKRPGTISLGQGVVYYGPPPEAIEQIEEFLKKGENHKYHAVQGIKPLRDVIRKKLESENGIQISREEEGYRLCVTAGGNMAFMNAVLAITDPSDEIILLTPYYFNHEMAIQIADSEPVRVPTDEEYQPDLEFIRHAITKKTRAVVTVSPNNPSGAVYPESALREINQLCKTHDIYHIHDEAYEYFTYGEAKRFSPGSIAGADGHTISLYSLSKAYGFASWRIGYMVYPAHLETPIHKIQDTILICPPVISQYAACGAMRVGASYCQSQIPEIAEVRGILLQEFERLRDRCAILPTQGAFYFLLKINDDFDEMELAEQLIREHGVAVMPGRAFGINGGCHFRIAYGALQKETAIEGVGRLVNGLQSILGA